MKQHNGNLKQTYKAPTRFICTNRACVWYSSDYTYPWENEKDRENWSNRNNSVMHCSFWLKFSRLVHY